MDYQNLTNAFGLDGGGYEFVKAPRALGNSVAIYDDPDPDYVPGLHETIGHDLYGLCLPMYAFAPSKNPFASKKYDWPDTFTHDEEQYKLAVHGDVSQSCPECNCHGKLVPWTGAAGEPDEPIAGAKLASWLMTSRVPWDSELHGRTDGWSGVMWECSGDSDDPAHPDCERCEGSGYLVAPGGGWALYSVIVDDDEDGID